MFTGIIEEVGTVAQLRREGQVIRLAIRAEVVRDGLRVGDSLATNGVCLTVERIEAAHLLLSAMPETLRRTTLGELAAGLAVNLERAVPMHGRLGGHLVAGHVDGIGVLRQITGAGEGRALTFTMPRELARFIAPKGSIAINGVSLTVVDADDATFSVALIRHTLGATTLDAMRPGDRVNLEVDLIARYLDRLLAGRAQGGMLTAERMADLDYGAR